MKKTLFLGISFSLLNLLSFAQTEDVNNAIKLFVNQYIVSGYNPSLETNQQERLYNKVIQIINQTGIAETGYSTFVVIPKFDILSNTVSETGMSQIFMAECELNISIKRAQYGDYSGAVFNSFTKRLIGSGSSKADAINNALNILSSRDNDIVSFFDKSKQKIDAYFKANCKAVIKEAAQALDLKDYGKSIALYFSVPSNAPCYNEAFAASKKVYGTFIEDECNKRLVMLKSYVALAQNQNASNKNYYDSAMTIMRSLSPASDKCYAEAKLQIEKIEKRLDTEQQREWELKKKLSSDNMEVRKEMYKAMGKINANYQPPAPSTNVIIAH